MQSTISVIIPVYNVEAYLRQCLDSVLSQSYPSLQVIVVDDGSTDRSGMICDEYAEKDPRVIVIHQENGGAAAAKNTGLSVAVGRYLSFVDSDDFLEPGAYTHMVKLLNDYNADAVQCGYREVFLNSETERCTTDQQKVYDTESYIQMYTSDWTCGLLWDKLYVRSVFGGICFEEGHKIDDEYFTYQGMMNARKIVRDDAVVYNYRIRRSGVMQSQQSAGQIIADRVDYLAKRRKNVIARFPGLRSLFDRHFVEMMVILSREPATTKESMIAIKKQLWAYFKEKGHTAVDYRLWRPLLGIAFGRVRKRTELVAESKSAIMVHYFD